MIVDGLNVDGVIKIDNARVYGLTESIIASGYPMMTETFDMEFVQEEMTDRDYKRANHLGRAIPGSGHDCYLKGIIIQFDMQVPEYIWRQWDRYHFNDYVSSQSKMHRILKLDIDKSCNKYVSEDVIDILNEFIEIYNNFDKLREDRKLLEFITIRGNSFKMSRENLFNIIVANCPMGLMLTARVTLNYLQAKSIKGQRKHHKMQEWHYICDFFDSLPKFKELTERV